MDPELLPDHTTNDRAAKPSMTLAINSMIDSIDIQMHYARIQRGSLVLTYDEVWIAIAIDIASR